MIASGDLTMWCDTPGLWPASTPATVRDLRVAGRNLVSCDWPRTHLLSAASMDPVQLPGVGGWPLVRSLCAGRMCRSAVDNAVDLVRHPSGQLDPPPYPPYGRLHSHVGASFYARRRMISLPPLGHTTT